MRGLGGWAKHTLDLYFLQKTFSPKNFGFEFFYEPHPPLARSARHGQTALVFFDPHQRKPVGIQSCFSYCESLQRNSNLFSKHGRPWLGLPSPPWPSAPPACTENLFVFIFREGGVNFDDEGDLIWARILGDFELK